jgi:hypothetical protein
MKPFYRKMAANSIFLQNGDRSHRYLIDLPTRREGVCGSGGIDRTFLTSAIDRSEWLAPWPGLFSLAEAAAGAGYITGFLFGLRADLEAVERKIHLRLPGIKLRFLDNLARSLVVTRTELSRFSTKWSQYFIGTKRNTLASSAARAAVSIPGYHIESDVCRTLYCI